MIDFLLSFYIETPVLAGFITGGMLCGGVGAIVGWSFGFDACRYRTDRILRRDDGIYGDVPNLPPIRERRFNPVAHREMLS